MVRRDVVAAKVGRARAWLNDAASCLRNPLEAFLADPQTRDLSLFYLFLAIQECIDLAAHWVADEGWGQPDDAGSAFDMLADRNVIDRETATALRAASDCGTGLLTDTRCSTTNVSTARLRPTCPHCGDFWSPSPARRESGRTNAEEVEARCRRSDPLRPHDARNDQPGVCRL